MQMQFKSQKAMMFLLSIILIINSMASMESEFLNKKSKDDVFTNWTTSQNISPWILSQFITPPTLSIDYATGTFPIGSHSFFTNSSTGSDSRIFYVLNSANGTKINYTNATDYNYSKPLILWLQGGPGASGWFGAGFEIGPYNVVNFNDTSNMAQLQENPFTWARDSYLLFIDQPVGTGYSPIIGNSSGNVQFTNTTELATDIIASFLDQFFIVYPNLKKLPFYIGGESYGGHYIPSLGAKLQKNRGINNINLVGVMCGDGWTHPRVQTQIYPSYYYSAGLVSTFRLKQYKNFAGQFEEYFMNDGMYHEAYEKMHQYFVDAGTKPDAFPLMTGDVFVLNYRVYGQDLMNPVQLNNWLSSTVAKQNFWVDPNEPFIMGNNDIYHAFQWDYTMDFANNYTYLLDNNIRVLLYSGQNDPDVPTPGQVNFINDMAWTGLDNWRSIPKQFLYDQNQNYVGTLKTDGLFYFAFVNNAGHMVPHDQPFTAYKMYRDFMFPTVPWP